MTKPRKTVRAVVKCTLGFVVEGKQLAGIHTAARLAFLISFMMGFCFLWDFCHFFFFGGGGGVSFLLTPHFCIMATNQRRYRPHLTAFDVLNNANNANQDCTTVMKVMAVAGRKKMVTFFQMWWMKQLHRMTLALPQIMTAVIFICDSADINYTILFIQGYSIMYAQLSCEIVWWHSVNWVNCSEFPQHMTCAEPGSEGVKGPVQHVCCAAERIENVEERGKNHRHVMTVSFWCLYWISRYSLFCIILPGPWLYIGNNLLCLFYYYLFCLFVLFSFWRE